jgi:hypothetical protein
MHDSAIMKKFLRWTVAVALLLVFVHLSFMWLRPRGMGAGSYEYARQWRRQLLACQSLEDVKQHFNCFVMEWSAGGGGTRVEVTETVAGRPHALLKSFPDGRWIACAHADSHGEPGGGTIVSRDSSGEIHIFFGHVCGRLYARGETLEEFYASLRGYFNIKEVFLRQ